MYKTIIIIIVRRPIILGYQIAPLFHLSAALHTHAQMRIKAKVYFGRPRTRPYYVIFVIKRAHGQSRTPSECSNFVRPRKSSWWSCAFVELVRPHSSAAEYTLNAAADAAVRETEMNGTQKVKYTWAFRLLLLIGNVLKTDSKTKPTSKFNCRVIIFIYKLGYVKSAKRDIF